MGASPPVPILCRKKQTMARLLLSNAHFVTFVFLMIAVSIERSVKSLWVSESFMMLPFPANAFTFVHAVAIILHLLGFITAFFPHRLSKKLPFVNGKKAKKHSGEWALFIRYTFVIVAQTLNGYYISRAVADTSVATNYALLILIDLVLQCLVLNIAHKRFPAVAKVVPYIFSNIFDILYGVIYSFLLSLQMKDFLAKGGSNILNLDVIKAEAFLRGHASFMTTLPDIVFVKLAFAICITVTNMALLNFVNSQRGDGSGEIAPMAGGVQESKPDQKTREKRAKKGRVSTALRVYSLVAAIYGIAIFAIALTAAGNDACKSNNPPCRLVVKPWFTKECQCRVMDFKCMPTGDQGKGKAPAVPALLHDPTVSDLDKEMDVRLAAQSELLYVLNIINCRSEAISSKSLSKFRELTTLRFIMMPGVAQRQWNWTDMPTTLTHLAIENADMGPALVIPNSPAQDLFNLPANIRQFECNTCNLLSDLFPKAIPNKGWQHVKEINLQNNLLGLELFNSLKPSAANPMLIVPGTGGFVLFQTYPFPFLDDDAMALDYLYLDSNKVTTIPATFGKNKALPKLQVLGLSFSGWKAYPSTVLDLTELTAVFAHASPYMTSFPDDLYKLTKLDFLTTNASHVCDTSTPRPWYEQLKPSLKQGVDDACAIDAKPRDIPECVLEGGVYDPAETPFVFPGRCNSACYYNPKLCAKDVCGECGSLDDSKLPPLVPPSKADFGGPPEVVFKCNPTGNNGTDFCDSSATTDAAANAEGKTLTAKLMALGNKYVQKLTIVNCKSEIITNEALAAFSQLQKLYFVSVSGLPGRTWELEKLPPTLSTLSIENANFAGAFVTPQSPALALLKLPSHITVFECINCGILSDNFPKTIPDGGWSSLKTLNLENNLFGLETNDPAKPYANTPALIVPDTGSTLLFNVNPFLFLNDTTIALDFAYLDGNKLAALPATFGAYHSLQQTKVLGVAFSVWQHFPPQLVELKQLVVLLSHACPYLNALPDDFYTLDRLQVLSTDATGAGLCDRDTRGSWFDKLNPYIKKGIEDTCAKAPSIPACALQGEPFVQKEIPAVLPGSCSSQCYFNPHLCDKSFCGACAMLNDVAMPPQVKACTAP